MRLPHPRHRENLVLTDTSESRALALAAADAAADKKATNVRILDIGDLLGITDFFVLASARNDRQLATVAEAVQEALHTRHARKPRRREGTRDTGWMLLDYGDVVVHAFTEEQRGFYDLERLWGDAPVVPFDARDGDGQAPVDEAEAGAHRAPSAWYATGDA